MGFFNRKYSSKYRDIDPDEIFLDSRNAPKFDIHQLEGRLEKPISKWAPRIVGIFFLLIILTFTGKLVSLQITNSSLYVTRSENNNLHHEVIFADRGIIYDRNGLELAWNEPNLDGDHSTRKYSELEGLSHVLGYVSYPQKDDQGIYYQEEFVGKDGLEKSIDNVIVGINGIKISETDVFQELVSESEIVHPQNGKDIILSIDGEIQSQLYGYIKNLARSANFKGGSAVIMDVNTGDIIALTNYPEYSSQVLTDGEDESLISSYLTDQYTPFLNRATMGLYTPGSVVKPFIAIGALNEGIIDEHTKILSTGSIRIQNPYDPELFTIFNDWKAHGLVDMREALAVSSNVYFYEISGGFEDRVGLGIERIEKYISAFGVGKKTGVENLSEVEGILPNPEWKEKNFEDGVWRLGDTYNTAIGQYGFQVTPIQMARATAGIANNGILVTPRIDINEKVEKKKVPIDIDQHYIDVVKSGMRQSVTDGSSQGLNVVHVEVAAKTGTAQLGTQKKLINSWVTGFFPYDEPRYAFAIVMERGPETNLVGALFTMRNLLDWMSVDKPEYLN